MRIAHRQRRVGEIEVIAVQRGIVARIVRLHADEEETAGHLFKVIRKIFAAHGGMRCRHERVFSQAHRVVCAT